MPGGRGTGGVARIGAAATGWALLWLAAWLLEAAAAMAAIWLAGRHGPALLAVLLNLAVCLRFATTLRPGEVPLITRYSRFDGVPASPRCDAYTRRLTAVWAVLLGLFALAQAGAVLDHWTTRQVSALEGALLLLLFLAEHPLRGRLFPELGPVTPLRTLRAMRLAIGARHAA
jgi:uncharacterized membrane protein